MIALNEWIIEEEARINRELFKKYFHSQRPSALLKDLYKINGPEKKNIIVSLINGLKDLKKGIEKMYKKERENEKPDKIVEIVEENLKFNKQTQEGKV